MQSFLFARINNALHEPRAAEALVTLVYELSATGYVRRELYDLFSQFRLSLSDDDILREPVELVMDRLWGWCRKDWVLLPDEPLHELAIFHWWHCHKKSGMTAEKLYEASAIFPDSIPVVWTADFASTIFYIGKTVGDYVWLRQNDLSFRVKKSEVRYVAHEGFFLGDRVSVLSNGGKNTQKEGVICDMIYHHKKEQLYYHLIGTNGKRLKKMYFKEDLRKI